MRKISIFAGAALACLGLSAASAGAQPFMSGPWSGFYLGGNLGGAFHPNDLSFADLSSSQDLFFHSQNDGTRFIGGVHGGYDWQMGGVLIGVEGDADFAKDIDYLTTVRGRLGIPAGPFLVYGTAGGAWEGAHEHFDIASASGGLSTFNRHINPTGWTAGGGVETFVMPAVSVGVEGLYYGLGSDTQALTTPAATGAQEFAVKDDRNFAVVRARLTYHFGW